MDYSPYTSLWLAVRGCSMRRIAYVLSLVVVCAGSAVQAQSTAAFAARLSALEARVARLEGRDAPGPGGSAMAPRAATVTLDAGSTFAIAPRGCAHAGTTLTCRLVVERLAGGGSKSILIISNSRVAVSSIMGGGEQYPASRAVLAHNQDLAEGNLPLLLDPGEQATVDLLFQNADVAPGPAKLVLKVAARLDAEHRAVTTMSLETVVAN